MMVKYRPDVSQILFIVVLLPQALVEVQPYVYLFGAHSLKLVGEFCEVEYDSHWIYHDSLATVLAKNEKKE